MSVERSELNVERSAPKGAVFLSYAREDAPAAQRIAEALRGFGVEVWFDQSELRGGDQWDAKIRAQIKACALFIPVISATTQSRDEAYFRLEWKLADDRSHLMAAGKTFIVPVVIDDTPEAGAVVPDSFGRSQWTRLPGGEPTTAFIEQVKRLLDAPRKPALKPDLPRPPTLPPEFKQAAEARAAAEAAAKAKPAVPGWMWGMLVVVIAVAVAGMIFLRQPAPVVPPPAAVAKQTTATVSPGALAKEDKSIAVLPFANMSEDKESGFFADGVHEDILTNLALIRELRVVSRTSVMPYRTTTKSMRQIAQELGVTYILEGSVRRAGNKVRVTGQLIDARNDEHVWAKSYDRDLIDIFAIQSELSQQIAAALQTVLSPEEKILLARRPTQNPAAYDLFLRARDVLNREGNTRAAIERRLQLMQSAVDLDPDFAQAWAELADACAFAYFSDTEGKDALLARAKGAMDRAVQLAPDDPEVIGSLGNYYYYGYRDYARAVEQYEKLARLQPNAPRVFSSLGLIQRRQGRWAESLVNTRRATELDPANLDYLRNLLDTSVAGRRWDEAIATQRRIVTLLPDKPGEGYQLAVLAFQATGSTREGEAFFAGLSPEQRESPRGISLRQAWAAKTGNFAEAVRLDRQQPYFDEDGTPHWWQAYGAALCYLAAGDQAGAKTRLGDFPAELRAGLKREPTNLYYWAFLSGMEAILGDKKEARRLADRCVELMPLSRDALNGATYANFRTLVYDWTGDRETALAEYTRLFRIPTPRFGNIHEMKSGYSTLRGDPRFEALLADPKNNTPLF